MERNDWHLREASSVLSELKTDMYTGLTSAEAVRRRKREGANRIWYIRRTSVRETIIACLSDLATLLLIITAVFAAVFEESRSALAIVVVLALGAALRTATYCKAKRILEDNASEGIPTCSVLRDGQMQLLSAEELVAGDIVFLEGGDMVPGDGRIVAGDELAVSERGITANRDTVQKFETVIRTAESGGAVPAEYRSNLLYAGSTVLWGQARMVITAAGSDTLIVRKQGGIRVEAGEKLPFEDRLNGWCRTSSLTMLACVMVITALALFLGHGFTRTFLVSMALAVASMSEYLTSIAYSIIAVAMQDTGRRRRGKRDGKQRKAAIINDSAAIERIAGLRRLVLSDIRLLKSGEMALHSWFAAGELHDFNRFAAEGKQNEGLAELLRLLLATVGGKQLHTSLSGGAITAMPEKFTMLHCAADTYTKHTGAPVDFSFTALDSVDGKTGISGGLDTVLLQEKGDIFAVVSGEIRQVMGCCTAWADEKGRTVPLEEAMRRKIFTEAARLTFMGAKVIACARRSSPYSTLNRLSLLQTNMTFMGFCAIAEPPAEGVKEAAAQLKRAGVSLLLLSDDPERDLYYGHEIGLFDKKTVMLTQGTAGSLPGRGTAIVEMPPVQTPTLSRNVNHSQTRYARLQALLTGGKGKKKAARTAVLVRNVLDARLMTLGDVAVAVGDSDTRPLPQPLKARADVIVYPGGGNGGLTETVEAMCQSRRALYHLRCAAVYLSASQISRMVLLLFAVIAGFAMPSAEVLLGIGLVMDFAAVLVMAFIRVPEEALTIPGEQMGLPRGKKAFFSTAGLGLLWGGLEGILPLLCGFLDTPYTGILIASILLSQLLLSGAVGHRQSFFRCRFHVAYVLYALAAVLAAGTALLVWPALWYAYFFTLIPSVVLVTVWETVKWSRKKKRSGSRKDRHSGKKEQESSAAAETEGQPTAESGAEDTLAKEQTEEKASEN
ncbi:MAG: cation-transporting P-type ATPase [Clostridia bacterium]|nr:cation-transporting P-type ATPase [Clostridia bacterium]